MSDEEKRVYFLHSLAFFSSPSWYIFSGRLHPCSQLDPTWKRACSGVFQTWISCEVVRIEGSTWSCFVEFLTGYISCFLRPKDGFSAFQNLQVNSEVIFISIGEPNKRGPGAWNLWGMKCSLRIDDVHPST